MQSDPVRTIRSVPVTSSGLDPAVNFSSRPPSGPVREVGMGLPIPRFPVRSRASDAHYVVTTTDLRGRLADRSPLRVLAWSPGTGVAIEIHDGPLVHVIGTTSGHYTITKQGHLCLPLAVRRVCHIEAGDRLLVAARPDSSDLVVWSVAVLQAPGRSGLRGVWSDRIFGL